MAVVIQKVLMGYPHVSGTMLSIRGNKYGKTVHRPRNNSLRREIHTPKTTYNVVPTINRQKKSNQTKRHQDSASIFVTLTAA
jgi:hypothetical protein